MVHRDTISTQFQMKGERFNPLDDYPIHQVARSIGVSGGGEPEWFEHDVAYLIPPGIRDRPYMLNWFQFKPNQDLLQSWTMLNHQGTQYNFVMSRPLGRDRAAMRLGPLEFKIEEAAQRYSVNLREDDGLPFSFSWIFEARNDVKLFDKRAYSEQGADFRVEHCVTNQALQVKEGSVTIDGRVFDVSGHLGFRDHCWGRRSGPHIDRGFHTPMFAQFSDFSLAIWYEELTNGTPLYAVGHVIHDGSGETVRFVEFEHDWEFDPDTSDSIRQDWRLVDERGTERRLSVHRLVQGGFQRYSETSGERLHHSGAAPVERSGLLSWSLQKIDVSDPDVLASEWAREQRQQYCEFRLDDEIGYGVVMPYVSPRHVKYGRQLGS